MKKLFVLTVFIFFFFFSKAQSLTPDVIASSGNYFSSASGSIAWTLGETMIETYSSFGNFLTQGFHQPFSISTGIVSFSGEMNIWVYPNPASETLSIEFQNVPEGNYVMEMYDMLGQKIYSKEIFVPKKFLERLDTKNFSAGVYVLNIYSAYAVKKTFSVYKPE